MPNTNGSFGEMKKFSCCEDRTKFNCCIKTYDVMHDAVAMTPIKLLYHTNIELNRWAWANDCARWSYTVAAMVVCVWILNAHTSCIHLENKLANICCLEVNTKINVDKIKQNCLSPVWCWWCFWFVLCYTPFHSIWYGYCAYCQLLKHFHYSASSMA